MKIEIGDEIIILTKRNIPTVYVPKQKRPPKKQIPIIKWGELIVQLNEFLRKRSTTNSEEIITFIKEKIEPLQ